MPKCHCSVVGCHNGTYSLQKWKEGYCNVHKVTYGIGRCICEPPFQLFPFPTEARDPGRRKQWTQLVNRVDPETGQPWLPSPQSRVCSKHFVDGRPTTKHPNPTLHMVYGDSLSKTKGNPRFKKQLGSLEKKFKYSSAATEVKMNEDASESPAVVETAAALLELAATERNSEKTVERAFKILQNAAKTNGKFFSDVVENATGISKLDTHGNNHETMETAEALLELAAENHNKSIKEVPVCRWTSDVKKLKQEVSNTDSVTETPETAADGKYMKLESLSTPPSNQAADTVLSEVVENAVKTLKTENERTKGGSFLTNQVLSGTCNIPDLITLEAAPKTIKFETMTPVYATAESSSDKWEINKTVNSFNELTETAKLKKVITKAVETAAKIAKNTNGESVYEEVQIKQISPVGTSEISKTETAIKTENTDTFKTGNRNWCEAV